MADMNNSSLEHNCWVVFLSFALLVSSCTPTTGTRIALSQTNLTKLKAIGVIVKADESFSVRLSREEMTGTGAVLGSGFGIVGALVGTAIEAGGRHSADTHLEEQFKPLLSDYDPTNQLNEKLRHYLRLAAPFKAVPITGAEDTTMLKETQPDGVLEVTLREWGLRRCVGPARENVQVGLNIHGRVFLREEGATVWERDELYLDGRCHSSQDFRSKEGLLRDLLTAAIDNLSGKIVNDILFP